MMEAFPLTKTEGKVYRFIIDYKKANDGVAPSVRDIVDGTGVRSTSHVAQILGRLVSKELITMDSRIPRSIQVIGGEWSLETIERKGQND